MTRPGSVSVRASAARELVRCIDGLSNWPASEAWLPAGRCVWIRPAVETNIHYPTDSSLLGDGARVLTRTMKKIERQAGKLKRKVRDRTRSVNKRVRAIAMASRLDSSGQRRAPKETVSRVVALFATDSQRQQ